MFSSLNNKTKQKTLIREKSDKAIENKPKFYLWDVQLQWFE